MPAYQFKLARSDSAADRHFTLELDSRMTVLDALFIIQREHDPSLAVSIGVSHTGPLEFEEPEKLLHAADTRMYEEKARHHGGRQPAAASLAA